MARSKRRRLAGLLLAAIAVLPGCGGGGGSVSSQVPEDSLYLQTLAEDYRMYSITKKQPPRSVDDLKSLGTIVSPAVEQVRLGNILVEWGATLPDTMEEPGQSPAAEVLAYGKDVPTAGGYVLRLNRTVARMTADEFKAAPKAAKKP